MIYITCLSYNNGCAVKKCLMNYLATIACVTEHVRHPLFLIASASRVGKLPAGT